MKKRKPPHRPSVYLRCVLCGAEMTSTLPHCSAAVCVERWQKQTDELVDDATSGGGIKYRQTGGGYRVNRCRTK